MRYAYSVTTMLVLASFAFAQKSDQPFPGKYLLPDADFVLVLNAKQVRKTQAFKKYYQQDLLKLVQMDKVKTVLQDLGVAPLKDIDYVSLAQGRSCYEKNKMFAAPQIVFRGRFDAEKLLAAAKKYGKASGKHQETPIFQVKLSPNEILYAAIVDKNHVVLAPMKSQIQHALDVAAGKQKPTIKNKEIARMLQGRSGKNAVVVVANGDMIIGGTSQGKVGPNGKVIVTKTKLDTLRESAGLETLEIRVQVNKETKATARMRATDAKKAEEVLAAIRKNVKKRPAALKNKYPNLDKAMEGLNVKKKGPIVTATARGEGPVLRELFLAMFTVEPSPEPPPGEDRPTKRPIRREAKDD